MSNEQELPPLPKPWGHYPSHLQIACYTGSQMHDYARAAIAATPAPEPLTEREIVRLWREPFDRKNEDSWFVEFARAIERAHGIGGDK